MGKVKILHCADLHIGAAESFLGEKADSRRYETLITFEKIVDLAIAENVKVVAIAGDLFDANTIENSFFVSVINKISASDDIKFVLSMGNHDPLDSRSPFLKAKLPENLFILDKKDCCITFDDIGLCVYGRSFESAFLKGEETFGLKIQNNDYVNLMVQHGELKTDLNSRYNSITRRFIEESGMDYIALGHIHKRTDIGKIGKTYFAYCGCPEGQGFDETDQKGVYLGEIGDGQCNLKFIPVAKRQHIVEDIDISSLTDSSEISEKIIATLKEKYGDNYSENLYKIGLVGQFDSEKELLVSEINSRIADKVYFVKTKDKTEPAYQLEVLQKEASLKGIFVKKMLERMSNADEEEKKLMHSALIVGLKAFTKEVGYVED